MTEAAWHVRLEQLENEKVMSYHEMPKCDSMCGTEDRFVRSHYYKLPGSSGPFSLSIDAEPSREPSYVHHATLGVMPSDETDIRLFCLFWGVESRHGYDLPMVVVVHL